MSSPPQQQSIPLVLIGGHRSVAISTQEVLNDTPYKVAAVLDVFDAPDDHKYSPQNLSALLHALHPRPRILVTGTALEHIVPEVRQVWERYVKMLRDEGDAASVLYVPLTDFYSAPGPPAPGTVEYLMEKMDAVFRPESK